MDFFAILAEKSPNMIFINCRGKVIYANKKCEEIMGYSRREFYSNSFDFFCLMAPSSIEKTKKAMLLHKQGKEVAPYEYELKTKEGKIIDAIITTKLIANKNEPAVLGIVTDISRQKNVERDLIASEQNYRAIIDSFADPIYVVDRNLRILLLNAALKKVTSELGLIQDPVGKTIFESFPFLLKDGMQEEYKQVFDSGKVLVTLEENVVNGHRTQTETRKIPVITNDETVRVITAIRDITKAKNNEKELFNLNKVLQQSNKKLEKLVVRDSHTGLYNHRFLGKKLDAEFSRARRKSAPLSILLMDVDYFKSINDVYGHQFGDLVLRQFAQKIKKIVRKYDIAIRYGGEEFIIISPHTDCETAKALGQRIIDSVNLENFGNKNHSIKMRLSIAVCSYPLDYTTNSAGMIDLSDRILNKAKELGGNRVFSSEDLADDARSSRANGKDKGKKGINYLKEKMDRLHKRANQSLIEAVFAFAKTIELKDHYTGEHVERTVYYATEIARRFGMSKEEIVHIRQAAILHDLGKVGIGERILLKPAQLTAKEFEEIMEHPLIGADIIRPIHLLHNIIPYILYHHERWDGKGYPQKLKEEEIPLGARIISLADTYQALISKRPYRKAFSKKRALAIIKGNSGTQFDPKVVDAFIEVIKKNHFLI
jgi:diguanylate cyclase (GGDEF)-like protein/PAS domain S-box-containing protein